MDGFETYLLLLPSGAGGHDRDAERLRIIAELHGYDGWLLGCREVGPRRGRRQIMVTPLEVLGTPSGAIGAGLAAAGGLHGCVYVLTAAISPRVTARSPPRSGSGARSGRSSDPPGRPGFS
jgi:hypothetical protein